MTSSTEEFVASSADTGLVLAAGAGSRFGRPKADVVLVGLRLLDRAVAALADGGCAELIVVLRAGSPPPARVGVRVIVNPRPEDGMSSSLRLGLAAATGSRVLIMVVDRPGIGSDSVARIRAVSGPVVVASFAGEPGHPVAIMRKYWDEVCELAIGDQGARAFLRAHPELITEVACDGDASDIDTPADLADWGTRLRR